MDETALREIIGEPRELTKAKIADHIHPLNYRYIELSPFVVVATGRPDGGLDVSPRGETSRPPSGRPVATTTNGESSM